MSAVLEIRNLRLSIRTDEGAAHILDRVELALPRGRILGVVGESGCGKSTLVRAILGILPKATTVESGEILFEGEDLLRLSERELARRVRGSRIGRAHRRHRQGHEHDDDRPGHVGRTLTHPAVWRPP